MPLSTMGFFLSVLSACGFVLGAQQKVASQKPSGDMHLRQYLEELSTKFDCYFTVEEIPLRGQSEWILAFRMQYDVNVVSLEQALSTLRKQMPQIRFCRDKSNTAIVHIVDVRLGRQRNYIMEQPVEVKYSGPVQSLVDAIGRKCDDQIQSRRHLGAEGFGPDMTTRVRVSARGGPIRRVLTDYVPLSEYERIL